jgi:hypothetical protein
LEAAVILYLAIGAVLGFWVIPMLLGMLGAGRSQPAEG